MLHLLDPAGYPLSDLENFRRRVRERQTVAEATLDLADDASSYFAGESLQRLEHLFADDTRLLDLCQSVRRHLVDDVASATRIRSLRALRTHLTEAYRLHRRLLRTRRDDPRVQLHLPRRMGAIRVEYEDEARREASISSTRGGWPCQCPLTSRRHPTTHRSLLSGCSRLLAPSCARSEY